MYISLFVEPENGSYRFLMPISSSYQDKTLNEFTKNETKLLKIRGTLIKHFLKGQKTTNGAIV